VAEVDRYVKAETLRKERKVRKAEAVKVGCYFNNPGDLDYLKPLIHQFLQRTSLNIVLDFHPSEKMQAGFFFARLSTSRVERVKQESYEAASKQCGRLVFVACHYSKSMEIMENPTNNSEMKQEKPWLTPEETIQLIFYNEKPTLVDDGNRLNERAVRLVEGYFKNNFKEAAAKKPWFSMPNWLGGK